MINNYSRPRSWVSRGLYVPRVDRNRGQVGTVPIFGEKNWGTSCRPRVYSPVIGNCPSY
jgi:hypothetical protein